MTPKEKAQELVTNFSFLQYDQVEGVKIKGNATITLKSATKQCALIAVDELINSYAAYQNMYDQAYFSSEGEYWQEVKIEVVWIAINKFLTWYNNQKQ